MTAVTSVAKDVRIHVDDVALEGLLAIPTKASGVVIFAHGAGSSRWSPRNVAVANSLRADGRLGTLLFDLLSEDEDVDYSRRFDIELLTGRLTAVTRWLHDQPSMQDLRIGYFGASTGAAAAIRAAAALGEGISAVVSRGGRPDLALEALDEVRAPVLLIVGGHDPVVLDLNRQAYDAIRAEKALEIVQGATHLFEEPGAIEQVSELAAAWFERHLTDEGP
jgi:putative phosphoribosyl transferase